MFLLFKEHYASPISFLILCRALFYSEVLRFVLLRSISGLGPAFVLPTSLPGHDWFSGGVRSSDGTLCCFLPLGCVDVCRGQCRYRSVPSVSSVSHFRRLVFFAQKPKKYSVLHLLTSSRTVLPVKWLFGSACCVSPSWCVALSLRIVSRCRLRRFLLSWAGRSLSFVPRLLGILLDSVSLHLSPRSLFSFCPVRYRFCSCFHGISSPLEVFHLLFVVNLHGSCH